MPSIFSTTLAVDFLSGTFFTKKQSYYLLAVFIADATNKENHETLLKL